MSVTKLRRLVDITHLQAAAKEGKLPTEIQLMLPGVWRTIKGEFTLGPAEFDKAAANFDRGVARVGGTAPLPINFNHNQSGPAAAWINGLENRGAEGLWATGVEWSSEGEAAIVGKVYRFFSIEYWFGFYEEPDTAGVYYDHVVEGGAMTNIPLMRQLKPVMASADKSTSGLTSDKLSNTIYIEQGDSPVDLTQLRAKANTDLTADERKFLADHKDELTSDEQVAFGFKADKAAEDKAAADKVAADKVEADRLAAEQNKNNEGKITMTAEEKTKLEADAAAGREALDKLNKAEISTVLAGHVKRGAIKPTAVEKWSTILASATGEARTALEEQLTDLPDNSIVASGVVGGDKAGDLGNAVDELHKQVTEKVAADKTLKYADVQKEILAADKDLADRINLERAESIN